MINFDYIKPTTQKAAIDALNKDASAQFIAGGTNLVDLMKRGVVSPEKLIDITSLPLKRIEMMHLCSMHRWLLFELSVLHNQS